MVSSLGGIAVVGSIPLGNVVGYGGMIPLLGNVVGYGGMIPLLGNVVGYVGMVPLLGNVVVVGGKSGTVPPRAVVAVLGDNEDENVGVTHNSSHLVAESQTTATPAPFLLVPCIETNAAVLNTLPGKAAAPGVDHIELTVRADEVSSEFRQPLDVDERLQSEHPHCQ